MSWLLLVLLAALIWSLSNLSDKFIEDHEVESSALSAGVVNLTNSLFFIFVPLFFVSFDELTSGFSWLTLIAGIIYGTSRLFYFSGVKREDVSRFIPLLALIPVFVTIYSFLFLGESFSSTVYIGITMTISGAILISLEDPIHTLKKFQSKVAVVAGIAAAVLLASKDISIKIISSNMNYWSIIFWLGVGLLLVSLLLITKGLKDKNLKNINYMGINHLIVSGSFKAVGSFLFTKAITIGPVSLVSTVVKVKPMLVFIGSTLLSRYHPEIIHEKLKRQTLIQKIAAMVVIIIGVGLVKIYS